MAGSRVMTERELETLIQALFDGVMPQVPDTFAALDPYRFAWSLTRTPSGQPRTGRAILRAETDAEAESAMAILAKLDQARLVLDGAAFDEVWQQVAIAVDDRGDEDVVDGSARLLPNGSVLFYRQGRVIAAEEQPITQLVCPSRELLDEALALAAGRHELAILHHDVSGVSFGDAVPDPLSEVGQTLLLVSTATLERATTDPEAFPRLSRDGVQEASTESVSGDVLIRLFPHRAYVHALYSPGNHARRLFRLCGLAIGTEPMHYAIGREYAVLVSRVRDLIRSRPNRFRFERLRLPLRLLAEHRYSQGQAIDRVAQLAELLPLIGPLPDCPVTDQDGLAAGLDGTASGAGMGKQPLVFVHSPAVAGSLDEGYGERCRAALARFLRHAEIDPERVGLRVEGVVPDAETVPVDSELAASQLAELGVQLSAAVDARLQGDESSLGLAAIEDDVLSDPGRYIAMIVTLDEDPDPLTWTGQALELSQAFPSLIQMQLPAYGYVSEFSRGVLEGGHYLPFLPYDQWSGSDPDQHDGESPR